jgi:hypothetical protein
MAVHANDASIVRGAPRRLLGLQLGEDPRSMLSQNHTGRDPRPQRLGNLLEAILAPELTADLA